MKNKFPKVLMLITSITVAISVLAAACGSSDSEDADDQTRQDSDTTTTTAVQNLDEGFTYDEIYEIFQADFDREHPFQSLDEFCKPHATTREARIATDPGISETEVTIVHIRTKLEELESIGFATNVGDPKEMFESFTQIVNDRCGGINGRQLKLVTIEVSALGGAGGSIDELRNAACIEATEDNDAVIVLNSTGFQGSAGLCLAERAIFISTQGQTQEFVTAGDGNLLSISPTLEDSLTYLADYVLATGELEGKTVGIVSPDTPGQVEATQTLQNRLVENGINVAVFDVIGCGGATACSDGVSESVQNLRDNDVDVLFPTLNVVSLPGYIREMVTQGFEQGDITFYNSDFNSQASELVSSKVVVFGGEESGNLYNGASIVDDARPGAFREEGYTEPLFNKMCADEYASISGVRWDVNDADENAAYGMISTVCGQMRMATRAIYDAGSNPTRADIKAAMLNLGPVDLNNMLPGSFALGKYSAPDAIHNVIFSYPCAVEGTGNSDNTCVVSTPDDQWRWVN